MADNQVTATTGGEASAEKKKEEPKEFLWRWKTVIALVALFAGWLLNTGWNYLNAPPAPRLTASADAFDYETPLAHAPIGEKAAFDAIPTPLSDNEILRHITSSTKFIKINIKNNGRKQAKGVKVIFNEGDFLYLVSSQPAARSSKSIATIGDLVAGQSEAVKVWGDAKLSEKMSIIHDDGAFDIAANRGDTSGQFAQWALYLWVFMSPLFAALITRGMVSRSALFALIRKPRTMLQSFVLGRRVLRVAIPDVKQSAGFPFCQKKEEADDLREFLRRRNVEVYVYEADGLWYVTFMEETELDNAKELIEKWVLERRSRATTPAPEQVSNHVPQPGGNNSPTLT